MEKEQNKKGARTSCRRPIVCLRMRVRFQGIRASQSRSAASSERPERPEDYTILSSSLVAQLSRAHSWRDSLHERLAARSPWRHSGQKSWDMNIRRARDEPRPDLLTVPAASFNFTTFSAVSLVEASSSCLPEAWMIELCGTRSVTLTMDPLGRQLTPHGSCYPSRPFLSDRTRASFEHGPIQHGNHARWSVHRDNVFVCSRPTFGGKKMLLYREQNWLSRRVTLCLELHRFSRRTCECSRVSRWRMMAKNIKTARSLDSNKSGGAGGTRVESIREDQQPIRCLFSTSLSHTHTHTHTHTGLGQGAAARDGALLSTLTPVKLRYDAS